MNFRLAFCLHSYVSIFEDAPPGQVAFGEGGVLTTEAVLTNTVLLRISYEFLRALVEGRHLSTIELTTRDGDFAYAFGQAWSAFG